MAGGFRRTVSSMPKGRLDTLLKKIRQCDICAADLPLGPRPVLTAHPGARILVIGQAPGRRVHESGVPWDDASGKRLREWLGVTPESFYDPKQFALVPMGFCYPGTSKSGDLPPRPECAQEWHERVLALMPDIRLTVLLSRYALDRYLGPRSSPRGFASGSVWPTRCCTTRAC